MISYRVATTEDIPQVCSLLKQIDESFPIPLSKKADLDQLSYKLGEKGIVCLSLNEDCPVGMVGFYANDGQARTAYISVVGVIEDYRHLGIASALLTMALEICKNQGMARCFLYTHKSNHGAISMYNKLGFKTEADADRPQDIKFVKAL